MGRDPLAWALNDIDKQLIKLAFQEDLGVAFQDITTDLLFKDEMRISTAKVISKHKDAIVLAGEPLIKPLFSLFDTKVDIQSAYTDGSLLEPGAVWMTITGPAAILLKVERTLLNFLQHLSAIATQTKKFTNAIRSTNCRVLDTRKTLPGFRHLDKYAVHCGGGVNHRLGLYDAIMIKDTHIDALGGMAYALQLVPDTILTKYPVIVEVRDKQELQYVLDHALHKTSRVLLDNMTQQQLTECVQLCESKIPTEASGDIDLNNVLKMAETGVDFVSIGKITHSAGSVNLSMKCEL